MSATCDAGGRAMNDTSSKSRLGQRKFSGTMSRISSSTFSRRRNTTTTLPSSVSSIQLNHQSRLPTPSGIPKSTSFLCSLNHFNHPSIDKNQPPQPIEQHRLPEQSSQAPSSSRRTSQIPRAASRTGSKPDCSVKIEQRGLMQPMQPPLPRSSTMGHLCSSQSLGVLQENTDTGRTDAGRDVRRQSIVLNKRNHTLTPPTRLVKLEKTPSGAFPKRKDSLMAPPPATAIAPVHYAAVSEAVAPQRAVSYDEEDTVIISRDFTPKPPPPPPKEQTRVMVRNISHFQEELGETEETDHHHASTVPSTPMPRSTQDYQPHSPLLAPTAYDQDEDPRFVYHAQQPTYWLGRYTALSDIFHTSALPDPIPPTTDRRDKAARMSMPFSSAASSSSDGFNGGKHPMQDQTTRLKHVYMQLRLSCVTEDAIQSFRLFEEMMEEVMGQPEKKAPIRTSAGVKEKKGWLEGLMARRKSSGMK